MQIFLSTRSAYFHWDKYAPCMTFPFKVIGSFFTQVFSWVMSSLPDEMPNCAVISEAGKVLQVSEYFLDIETFNIDYSPP